MKMTNKIPDLKALLALTLVALSAGNCLAVDMSVKASDTLKIDKDLSLIAKRTMSQTQSDGTRRSKSTTTSKEHSNTDSSRDTASASNSGTAEISVDLATVFSLKLSELEKTVEPFKSCQVLASPGLMSDFGITSSVGNGQDSIKRQMITDAAASNTAIEKVGGVSAEVRGYIGCLAKYGATVATAFDGLTKDLPLFKASLSRNKRTGEVSVSGIGYDDFVALAGTELENAVKTGPTSATVKMQLERVLSDKTACKFSGTAEAQKIQCGTSVVIISTSPELYSYTKPVYGNTFFGFSGTFKLSTGWSYAAALEQAKSDSRTSRFASEVSKYAEDLDSQGKNREAAYSRKKALDMSNGSEKSLSTASHGTYKMQ